MRAALFSLTFTLIVALPALAQQPTIDSTFSHPQHAKLFPTCEGCHRGIVSGEPSTSQPTVAQCRECHNGTDARVVAWRPYPRPQGMLRFSHPQHATKTDSSGRLCAACHASSPGAPWMSVQRATAETCATCHTHATNAHLAETNRCSSCHVALTEARGLTVARVAGLPKPPSHERPAFSTDHGRVGEIAIATCAVCHARESCASCHVNASTLPSITALGRDPRIATLVANRTPHYPEPADHQTNAFAWNHGAAAVQNVARCATCHARPSCRSCHTGTAATGVIAMLPEPEENGARGVELTNRPARLRTMPPFPHGAPLAVERAQQPASEPREVRVHAADYRTTHGPQAAAAALSCSGCHAQRFCSDCHAGGNTRRFHQANFVMRHAADAYGRETGCASCHNTEAFCRECHQQAGLASRGRLDVAFHTAQPLWLLQHGRAARQGLANCTSCHVQRDCMSCHSTTSWGINPHGRGFKADRMAQRVGVTCRYCHLTTPTSQRP